MANLRCSAAEESEDTLNVFTSPTGFVQGLTVGHECPLFSHQTLGCFRPEHPVHKHAAQSNATGFHCASETSELQQPPSLTTTRPLSHKKADCIHQLLHQLQCLSNQPSSVVQLRHVNMSSLIGRKLINSVREELLRTLSQQSCLSVVQRVRVALDFAVVFPLSNHRLHLLRSFHPKVVHLFAR